LSFVMLSFIFGLNRALTPLACWTDHPMLGKIFRQVIF